MRANNMIFTYPYSRSGFGPLGKKGGKSTKWKGRLASTSSRSIPRSRHYHVKWDSQNFAQDPALATTTNSPASRASRNYSLTKASRTMTKLGCLNCPLRKWHRSHGGLSSQSREGHSSTNMTSPWLLQPLSTSSGPWPDYGAIADHSRVHSRVLACSTTTLYLLHVLIRPRQTQSKGLTRLHSQSTFQRTCSINKNPPSLML